MRGASEVCGDAVLRYFWRGFADIFILTCGLSVLLDYAVRGLKKVWVTVIDDREVSAVLFTEIPSSASLGFVFLSQVFLFQLAQQLAQARTIIAQTIVAVFNGSS